MNSTKSNGLSQFSQVKQEKDLKIYYAHPWNKYSQKFIEINEIHTEYI
jgi:hypothetical protein